MLDKGLKAKRTLMIAQGFAVDHVHLKLFPVLKVNKTSPEPDTYALLNKLVKDEWYSGYIISMSGKEKATDQELINMSEQIRKANSDSKEKKP